MTEVTVRQALQAVADHPDLRTDVLLDLPVHELIARTLFDVANRPDDRVRGSMGRANKARKMLMDRLVGRRRPGTPPAARAEDTLEFEDLTMGALE